MRTTDLQLTLTDHRFSLTPLPGATACTCMSSRRCRNLASHRILSRRPAVVVLLCDDHTVEWTLNQAMNVTAPKPAA
jgi:hypothetical protein